MANEKAKGRWKRVALRLAGPTRARKILADAVRRQTADAPAFTFPLNAAAVKNILIILPPEKLQVLRQFRNIFELTAFFSRAQVTFLAEASCAPLAGLVESAEVVEYPLESKKLFSAVFSELNIRFKNAFDICCLLTRTEDLPLLNCAGRTGARLRIGYESAGGPPFLNVRVNPSADRTLASDWNCAMAEMLGAKKMKAWKWTIAKQTALEIDHLLKERHINPVALPVGIDALLFRRAYGAAWAEGCVNALLPYAKNNGYIYAEEAQDPQEIAWLERFNLPVLAGLSIPQTAALVARSGLVVTGNSLLFGLATLLGAREVGIFSSSEIAANCPIAPAVRGVAYEKSPGRETIEWIAGAMRELMGV
jgi:ADP-heptose:LPS heptosyltransferase